MTEYRDYLLKWTVIFSIVVYEVFGLLQYPIFLYPAEYLLRSVVAGFSLTWFKETIRTKKFFFLILAALSLLIGWLAVDFIASTFF